MWGADLCWKVSQGDFLVKEPVNPVPDRACHRHLTPQILVLPDLLPIEASAGAAPPAPRTTTPTLFFSTERAEGVESGRGRPGGRRQLPTRDSRLR